MNQPSNTAHTDSSMTVVLDAVTPLSLSLSLCVLQSIRARNRGTSTTCDI